MTTKALEQLYLLDPDRFTLFFLLLDTSFTFLCFVLVFVLALDFTFDLGLGLLDLDLDRDVVFDLASALLSLRLGATAFLLLFLFLFFFGVICLTIISSPGSFFSELESELRDVSLCKVLSIAMFSMRFSLSFSASSSFDIFLLDFDRDRFTSFICFLPFDFALDRVVLADLGSDVVLDLPRGRALDRPCLLATFVLLSFSAFLAVPFARPFFFVLARVYDEVILGV